MNKLFLFSLMLGVSPMVLADYQMTPREAIYYWASQGNSKNLKAIQKSGYSLDMPDKQGKQAICEAVDRNDVTAFKTLKKAGANMNVFCLYNMTQEKRYEFNQAYYGLPLILPSMTENMLEDEVPVPKGQSVDAYSESTDFIKIQQEEVVIKDNVHDTSDSYEKVTEDFSKQEGHEESDLTESVVFRPYVAANLFYAKGKGKLAVSGSKQNSSYKISDKTPGLSLAFGTRVANFRTELAIQGYGDLSEKVISNNVKTKVRSYAGLLNAYYDIPTSTKLLPYVGAGVGLTSNKASVSDNIVKYSGSDWSFAWQLAAGLNYALTDNLTADLGYRYTNYGKVNIVNENSVNYKVKDIRMHNVTLGLRYEM